MVEPIWSHLFTDELEQAAAKEHWRIITTELKERQLLAAARRPGCQDDRVLADQDQARSDQKQRYSKLENLERRLDDVDRKSEDLKSQLVQVKTTTAEIDRWKERFLGMRMLIVFIAAAFGASAATFGKWLLIKLGWTG